MFCLLSLLSYQFISQTNQVNMSSIISCKLENGTQVLMDYNLSNNETFIESSVKIGLAILSGTISIITVSGNLLVLAAIFCKPSLRSMRSNTFIASLAFTDLIVGAIVMPFSIQYYYFNSHWTYSEPMCHFWIFSDNISCTASIWTLVAIAVDRWLAVHQPVTYMGLQRCSSVLTVLGIWIMSISICIPTAIDLVAFECYCQSTQSDFHFFWTVALVFCVPAALIIFCYACIFVKLRQKMMKKRQSRANARSIEMVALDVSHDDLDTLNNTASWKVVRNWIRQKSFYYEQDTTSPDGLVSRKTSSTYLSPEMHGLARSPPPSPRPSSPINVNEISVRSNMQEEPQDNEASPAEPRKPTKVSFKESFRTRRQKMLNSGASSGPSSSDVAETREKRVLVQMSILVLVFVVCWLPFWSAFSALHLCHYLWADGAYCDSYSAGPVVVTLLQWLGYANSLVNPFLYNAFNREFRIGFAEIFVCCTSNG